ncbi:hypothetical protein CMV_005966 [Castanea mollissima]|uniref:Uncharacterized protein n=1 Tax=Castanea mollissima TaxID=60419 RepID=A0A8J4RQ88_9ROSI|nr:hypothetical protein CMV_005966 [Castanea mollissima]
MIASKSEIGFDAFEIPPISKVSKFDTDCFVDPPMSSLVDTILFSDVVAYLLPVIGLHGVKARSFSTPRTDQCIDGSKSKPLTSISLHIYPCFCLILLNVSSVTLDGHRSRRFSAVSQLPIKGPTHTPRFSLPRLSLFPSSR